MPFPFSTRNKLKTSEDIRELESCKKLSVLDISYNSLEEPDVLEVLAKMPELSSLDINCHHHHYHHHHHHHHPGGVGQDA